MKADRITSVWQKAGFHFDDFELAKREELLKLFPGHKGIIERLTRE